MRPAAVLKVLCAALVLVAAAAISVPVAHADFAECVQACIDQFDADKAECDAQLDATLAQLDQEAEDCLTNNPTDPIAAGLCIREVNIKRYRAQADHKRCISTANTVAYNCYRNCQNSPSAP